MNNEALYAEDGTFVGFCYIHQGRKVIEEGVEGCQHSKCLAFRDMPDRSFPMFNIERLKNQNQIGQTEREIEKEITETAKAEGREIERPT